jgi:hypothetical protein
MLSQGVVDPTTMSNRQPQQGMQSSYGGYSQPHMSYSYNTPQSATGPMQQRVDGHRASISSASDGSGNGGSDGSGKGELICSLLAQH